MGFFFPCIVCFIFSISLVAKKQPPNVNDYSAAQLSVQPGSSRGRSAKAAETSLNGFLSREICEGVLTTP